MIIDSIKLKTEYNFYKKKYSGTFFIDYKIPEISFLQTKIINFFDFYDQEDRIEDRTGVFFKFNKNLKTKFNVIQYVKYDYGNDPFMPYGIFKWFDQKISNEYNVEPIIDYAKKHKKTFVYNKKFETDICLIGLKLHFQTLTDKMKYKLLSE